MICFYRRDKNYLCMVHLIFFLEQIAEDTTLIIHFPIQMNILTLAREFFSHLKNDIFTHISFLYWQKSSGLRVFLCGFTFYLWTTNNETENFTWNVDVIRFADIKPFPSFWFLFSLCCVHLKMFAWICNLSLAVIFATGVATCNPVKKDWIRGNRH